jgi:hypothetical protein
MSPLSQICFISNLKRTGAVVIKKKLKMLNVNIHYISYLTPPGGQNRYPEDYKFHNSGRGLPALHHHAFSFLHISGCRVEDFENWSIVGSICPAPKAPWGAGTMKFTILFPFTHRCYKPTLVEIG